MRSIRRSASAREFPSNRWLAKLPPSGVALSAAYGFAGFISRILIGITALPIRALAEFFASSASFDHAGPLAIAQQQLRDFLTAERASVSVEV